MPGRVPAEGSTDPLYGCASRRAVHSDPAMRGGTVSPKREADLPRHRSAPIPLSLADNSLTREATMTSIEQQLRETQIMLGNWRIRAQAAEAQVEDLKT